MNIYEVTFSRTCFIDDCPVESRLKEKTWQIPAMGKWDACAKLGQLLPDEDYEINVLNIVKVG